MTRWCCASASNQGRLGCRPSPECRNRIGRPCPFSSISSLTPETVTWRLMPDCPFWCPWMELTRPSATGNLCPRFIQAKPRSSPLAGWLCRKLFKIPCESWSGAAVRCFYIDGGHDEPASREASLLTDGTACDTVRVWPRVFSEWGNGEVVLWKLVSEAACWSAGYGFSCGRR